MTEHKISVRNLIEFIYSSGDIDMRYINRVRLKDGTEAHRYLQKNYGDSAKAEVYITYEHNYDGVELKLSGRIDGLYYNNGAVLIEEIKSTAKDANEITEPLKIHMLQAKFYAFMYAYQNGLNVIDIQITYINISDKSTKCFNLSCDIVQLRAEVEEVIMLYLNYLKQIKQIKQNKDKSIKQLTFPYAYRQGQKNIMKNVYKTLMENKKLFMHAPTGSGKTLSVLFPSIKYIEGKDAKIFYLSGKGTQKNAALDALDILKSGGLCIKAVIIDAKEKVCRSDKVSCNPDDCACAAGYYDKVKEVILKMLNTHDFITRDIIAAYSEEYKICPFELSLDISRFCDVIICDYNYAFDPVASLKRYFEESGNYIFLIDEAHNLSERARGMYSAQLLKQELNNARKNIKSVKSVHNALGKINTSLNKISKYDDNNYCKIELKDEVFRHIRNFIEKTDAYAASIGKIPDEIAQFYLDMLRFLKIFTLAGKTHICYYDKVEKVLKLYCLDASAYLADTMKKCCGCVLFSATLLPSGYFMRISGGSENDYFMISKSPFDEKNLKVLSACDVELTYKKRNNNIDAIIKYINAVIEHKIGNYMVFFPSFEFMNAVYEAYAQKYANNNLLLQTPKMSEEEREEFILKFDEKGENTVCAFAVLGGSFAESIDLVGDKLIGTIIVSVGLPKVCYEREKLKTYYDSENKGFDYAYLYEGMNKVMQAGGRVIRSEADKGVVLLIDKRFGGGKYSRLAQNAWPNIKFTYGYEELVCELNK